MSATRSLALLFLAPTLALAQPPPLDSVHVVVRGTAYPAYVADFTPTVTDTLGPLPLVLGDPLQGCEAFDNAGEVAGTIVFLRRGTCRFDEKVANAYRAGAVAVVVANTIGLNQILRMGGNETDSTQIPAVGVSEQSGHALVDAIAAGPTEATLVPIRFSVSTEPEIPAPQASLSVFPNPALDEATAVLLALATRSEVHVVVYDVLGRRVALLQAGWLSAGDHALRFDVGRLPPGLYLLRATSPAFTATQRITVLR